MKKVCVLGFFLGLSFNLELKAQDVSTCMQDLSIFAEYVKVKNYASAVDPWTKVRENCPDINVAIYTYGERIIKDKIKNGSPEEIEASKRDLIQLYNEWVQYFPKNKNKSTIGDVMGKKAQALLDFKMADLKEIYSIFNDAFTKDPKSFTNPKFLYNYFLLGLMFPFATAILPLFLRVRDFGLLGTSWAVILPQIAFGLGFSIILFRGFFRQMPREIFDAAFVDGCSYYQFYFRFTLPLSTPIIATVSVITLTGSWNNYLLPLIMINDESLYSWPMGIMVFRGEYFTDWGKILAYVSLTLVPAVVFFFALQKYIVAGLTGGAVKE